MTPATWPREQPSQERLLHLDPATGRLEDRRVDDLAQVLRADDLLIVNDAATLPASLHGRTGAGADIEIRLIGPAEEAPGDWTVVTFGAGDWRSRTEDRPDPPPAPAGTELDFGDGLRAVVRRVSAVSPRLLDVAFAPTGDAFWPALYRRGRPVQYAYLRAPLPLWHTQTAYGSRPWAVEPPSAGRPLTWRLLDDLRRRGVGLARLTHAAGLSSTGDAAIDALLPLPERFDVPAATVEAVASARRAGGRVIAVGTTVVRALESAAAMNGGALRATTDLARLRIGPGFVPRIVDGVLTGMHEPDSSHFALLRAFAPTPALVAAHAHAEAAGYLCHEFGDSLLVLPAQAAARGLTD